MHTAGHVGALGDEQCTDYICTNQPSGLFVRQPLVASLLLVVRPGAPSSFLFLVAMPFAPSSVLMFVVCTNQPGGRKGFVDLEPPTHCKEAAGCTTGA